MKILHAKQIREVDGYTIKNEPIRSIDLMERAATRCAEWIGRRMKSIQKVHVFCGLGNNGGDGLAISRMLAGKGKKVTVYRINHSENVSGDFLVNEKRLNGVKNLHYTSISEGDTLPDPGYDELVIDAILGNGLTRPLEGLIADVVQHINGSDAVVVSVDMPTGLFGEDNGQNDLKKIIQADYTLTFQLPKLSFLLPSNDGFVGEWHVLDIGLDAEAIKSQESKYHLLEAEYIKHLYRPRKKFSHKGHYGHALLIAGSYGKMGAAVLSGKACLRSGAGLLSCAIPSCGYNIIQSTVPEAMCLPDEDSHIVTTIPFLEPYNAIAIGPGIGMGDDTQRAFKRLIQEATCPIIADADALNILSENPTWYDFMPRHSILTPHPKEFERLTGKTTNDYDRLMKAVEFSRRFELVIVLKGAHTAVIAPDGRCYFNTSGNPGMATAGSGDVLTGVLLGWLAQNYPPFESALMAVFLHGQAGDLALKGKSAEGIMASDLVEMLPKAGVKVFR